MLSSYLLILFNSIYINTHGTLITRIQLVKPPSSFLIPTQALPSLCQTHCNGFVIAGILPTPVDQLLFKVRAIFANCRENLNSQKLTGIRYCPKINDQSRFEHHTSWSPGSPCVRITSRPRRSPHIK